MRLSNKEQKRLRSQYGPWAIVTGASSGIGLELATHLAEAGFHLIIHARSTERLARIKRDLSTKYGIEIRTITSDLSKDDGVQVILNETKDLDVGLLVVSAGFGTSGPFLQSSIEEETNMLAVNCEALLRLTHHFSIQFSGQRRGGIVLLSSMVAFQGVPFAANYAATKAYVQSLAEALAVELKPHGVHVMAAAPGPVKSGFGKRANMKMAMAMAPSQIGAPVLKALGRRTTVLPGTLTKFLTYSLRTVPRWGKVRIMKKVMSGMTQHQLK